MHVAERSFTIASSLKIAGVGQETLLFCGEGSARVQSRALAIRSLELLSTPATPIVVNADPNADLGTMRKRTRRARGDHAETHQAQTSGKAETHTAQTRVKCGNAPGVDVGSMRKLLSRGIASGCATPPCCAVACPLAPSFSSRDHTALERLPAPLVHPCMARPTNATRPCKPRPPASTPFSTHKKHLRHRT